MWQMLFSPCKRIMLVGFLWTHNQMIFALIWFRHSITYHTNARTPRYVCVCTGDIQSTEIVAKVVHCCRRRCCCCWCHRSIDSAKHLEIAIFAFFASSFEIDTKLISKCEMMVCISISQNERCQFSFRRSLFHFVSHPHPTVEHKTFIKK